MVVLDSDIIITYLRRLPKTPSKEILARKQQAIKVFDYLTSSRSNGDRVKTTIFNLGELHVGVNRDPDKDNAQTTLSGFFQDIEILPFIMDDAMCFGSNLLFSM